MYDTVLGIFTQVTQIQHGGTSVVVRGKLVFLGTAVGGHESWLISLILYTMHSEDRLNLAF